MTESMSEDELNAFDRYPSREGLEDHQVWVWMTGPGVARWEIRGTGVMIDELRKEEIELRKSMLIWSDAYDAGAVDGMDGKVGTTRNPYMKDWLQIQRTIRRKTNEGNA